MNRRTTIGGLLVATVLLAQAAAAGGGGLHELLRTGPRGCTAGVCYAPAPCRCPDCYHPKPCPPIPCPQGGGCDHYCPKPIPCVRPPHISGGCDHYRPKPAPCIQSRCNPPFYRCPPAGPCGLPNLLRPAAAAEAGGAR